MSDSYFLPDVTFINLVARTSLILVMLFGLLFLAKKILSRNKFGSPTNLLDDLAQKITSTIPGLANNTGLKLKQILPLVPGQNLYLIEYEEKILLVGGTNQGGVHFLADLSCDSQSLKDLNSQFKHVDIFSNSQTETPFIVAKSTNNLQEEKNINNKNQEISPRTKDMVPVTNGQPFKRRVKFTQTLNMS
ncbi:MAG: hypothetical protein HYY52_05180 [Candidatus Melainabacteria bacterium]|nr:hypothetical protein [Candidatus Melainabacteria bacterium]